MKKAKDSLRGSVTIMQQVTQYNQKILLILVLHFSAD